MEDLREEEDQAQADVWDAESFAEDPWGSMGNLGITSVEIRQKRERAANAQLLLDQAREKLKALEEALEDAESEWSEAQHNYYDLQASPPAAIADQVTSRQLSY
jgi:hypothetical protein